MSDNIFTDATEAAVCSAHPACASVSDVRGNTALEGNCCPTDAGDMLECCSTNTTATTTTALPPPQIDLPPMFAFEPEVEETTTVLAPITATAATEESSPNRNSNTDDINTVVESLYSSSSSSSVANPSTSETSEMEPTLIGYSCKQIVEKNTVEEMDVTFYMDVLTPSSSSTQESSQSEQSVALDAIQSELLQQMSQSYGIDPYITRGVRCFELPMDGSTTWIVEMIIDPIQDFEEITLFGGCRQIDWNPSSGQQDCRFYEVHLRGSYIGAMNIDENGIPFGDVVAELETLVNGPKLVQTLNLYDGVTGTDAPYQTAFLGVPRNDKDVNPNFQGGVDQGRDVLNEPVNIKTSIETSESAAKDAPNRKSITLIGGLLVACFTIAILMAGFVLLRKQRKRSVRRRRGRRQSDANTERDLAVYGAGTNNTGSGEAVDFESGSGMNEFARHYNLDKEEEDGLDSYDTTDVDDHYDENMIHDDNSGYDKYDRGGNGGHNINGAIHCNNEAVLPTSTSPPSRRYSPATNQIAMSSEAIQKDLGESLKGQLMGRYGSPVATTTATHGNGGGGGGGPYGDGMPLHQNGGGFYNRQYPEGIGGQESDTDPDCDSWAQTDGTIGSLELPQQPITAEV